MRITIDRAADGLDAFEHFAHERLSRGQMSFVLVEPFDERFLVGAFRLELDAVLRLVLP